MAHSNFINRLIIIRSVFLRTIGLTFMLSLACACRDSEVRSEENVGVFITDSLLSEQYYQRSFELSNSAPDSAMWYARKSLEVSRQTTEEVKIANAFSQIAYIHSVKGENDSAIYYFQLSSDKYLEAQDINRYLTVRNNLGSILIEKSDFEGAYQVLQETKNISIKNNLKVHTSDAYGNLGLMEDYRGNVDSSFSYYKISLKYAKEANDTLRFMRTYNNIGVMFYYAEEYARAIPYFQKAISYNKDINHISNLSDNYINIGVAYDLLEENDSAYYYLTLALEAGKQLGNKLIQAKSYQNRGSLLFDENDVTGALRDFQQALFLKKESKEQLSLSSTYQYLSRIHLSLGDTIQSRIMLDSAMSSAIQVESREDIKECHELYVKFYKEIGDYKKALEYKEKEEQIKDSLFDVATIAAMYGLEIEYSTKEKDKTIQNLENNQWQIWLVSLMLILVLIAGYIFTISHFKNKQIVLNDKATRLSSESQKLKSEKQEEETKNRELIHRVNGQFIFADWYLDQKNTEIKQKKIDEIIFDIKKLLDALSSINRELTSNSMNPLQSSIYNIANELELVASELLNKQVVIKVDIHEIAIKKRDVVYICTLFNELAMNSIKYAFDVEDQPIITFVLKDLDNNYIHFRYHDNGLGNNTTSKSTGKGMGLVTKIVKLMEGGYNIDIDSGFSFDATFRKSFRDE